MRYAQIINGIVDLVIDTDSNPNGANGNWVACGDADPGYLYVDGVFVLPTPEPIKRHISVGQFFDSFGAQKLTILASSEPMVQALIKDCSVRYYIDLDNTQLPGGLDMLIASGFAIDKEEILNQAVQP